MVERCAFNTGDRIDNRYTVTKSLGEGAFGMVFKVSDSHGKEYALNVELLKNEKEIDIYKFVRKK